MERIVFLKGGHKIKVDDPDNLVPAAMQGQRALITLSGVYDSYAPNTPEYTFRADHIVGYSEKPEA